MKNDALIDALIELIAAVNKERKRIPRDEINLPSRHEYALTPLQARMRYLQDD